MKRYALQDTIHSSSGINPSLHIDELNYTEYTGSRKLSSSVLLKKNYTRLTRLIHKLS